MHMCVSACVHLCGVIWLLHGVRRVCESERGKKRPEQFGDEWEKEQRSEASRRKWAVTD